jgi:hypothetical protein
MKACIIPPTPEIKAFANDGDKMHLILAHLWSDDYVQLYRQLGKAGHYIILDNSAYELQVSVDLQELFRKAHEVGAHEVIMPDAMQDAEKTVELTGKAIHEMGLQALINGRPKFRPHYVAQGKSIVEYRECLGFIVRMHLTLFGDMPFTCGVSRVYADKFHGGRYDLIAEYYAYLHERLGDQMAVHLLGWGDHLDEIPRIARDFPWVRSVDTAKPINWALAGKELMKMNGSPEPRRPSDYFDVELTEEQRELAKVNCTLYHMACHGADLL